MYGNSVQYYPFHLRKKIIEKANKTRAHNELTSGSFYEFSITVVTDPKIKKSLRKFHT